MAVKRRTLNNEQIINLLKCKLAVLGVEFDILEEKDFSNFIFFCALKTINFFEFSSFGIGLKKEDAYVSALGELFERCSSLIVFHYLIGKNLKKGYPYKFIRQSLQVKNIKKTYSKNSPKQKNELDVIFSYSPQFYNSGKNILVPFQNLITKEEIWLPIYQVRKGAGSNGTATGGSLYESMFYGLCEVLERESISIFLNNIFSSKKINIEVLSDENKNLIRFFNKERIEISVYDISGNNLFPSVLVLAKNKVSSRVKVATHTDLDCCVRKALSELIQVCIYQGKMSLLLREGFVDKEKFKKSFSYSVFTILELGYFCDYKLLDSILEYSDLSAWEKYKDSKTYEDDFQKLLVLLNGLNKNVYCHTFFSNEIYTSLVYIPEYSNIFYKTHNYSDTLLFDMDVFLKKNKISLIKGIKKKYTNNYYWTAGRLRKFREFLSLFIDSSYPPGVMSPSDWLSYFLNLNPPSNEYLKPEYLISEIDAFLNNNGKHLFIVFDKLKKEIRQTNAFSKRNLRKKLIHFCKNIN